MESHFRESHSLAAGCKLTFPQDSFPKNLPNAHLPLFVSIMLARAATYKPRAVVAPFLQADYSWAPCVLPLTDQYAFLILFIVTLAYFCIETSLPCGFNYSSVSSMALRPMEGYYG